MKLLVLEAIAESRERRLAAKRAPPYVAHLTPRRAARLEAELGSLGVSFGIPLGRAVPDPREGDEEWRYLGLVLEDVHVYARVDAGGLPPR